MWISAQFKFLNYWKSLHKLTCQFSTQLNFYRVLSKISGFPWKDLLNKMKLLFYNKLVTEVDYHKHFVVNLMFRHWLKWKSSKVQSHKGRGIKKGNQTVLNLKKLLNHEEERKETCCCRCLYAQYRSHSWFLVHEINFHVSHVKYHFSFW